MRKFRSISKGGVGPRSFRIVTGRGIIPRRGFEGRRVITERTTMRKAILLRGGGRLLPLRGKAILGLFKGKVCRFQGKTIKTKGVSPQCDIGLMRTVRRGGCFGYGRRLVRFCEYSSSRVPPRALLGRTEGGSSLTVVVLSETTKRGVSGSDTGKRCCLSRRRRLLVTGIARMFSRTVTVLGMKCPVSLDFIRGCGIRNILCYKFNKVLTNPTLVSVLSKGRGPSKGLPSA